MLKPTEKGHCQSARHLTQDSLIAFLDMLFEPADLVELRAIETYLSQDGKGMSRLLARDWMTPREIIARSSEISKWNETANIFFGVNPRTARDGHKASIALCRHIWADFDNVAPAEMSCRFERVGLLPTMIVNSGHGVHAYWRLVNPVSVQKTDKRATFESMVKRFCAELGGDATHDCSRLLRLPGMLNVKNLRNGAPPVPCELLSIVSNRVYPLTAFSQWESEPASPLNLDGDSSESKSETHRAITAGFASASVGRSRDQRRIRGVLRLLEDPVADRSVRDFKVVSLLLSLNVSTEEIWTMVHDKSKFADAGEPYFKITIENARRNLKR